MCIYSIHMDSPTPVIFLFPGNFVFLACDERFPFQCPGASNFAPPSSNALAAERGTQLRLHTGPLPAGMSNGPQPSCIFLRASKLLRPSFIFHMIRYLFFRD